MYQNPYAPKVSSPLRHCRTASSYIDTTASNVDLAQVNPVQSKLDTKIPERVLIQQKLSRVRQAKSTRRHRNRASFGIFNDFYQAKARSPAPVYDVEFPSETESVSPPSNSASSPASQHAPSVSRDIQTSEKNEKLLADEVDFDAGDWEEEFDFEAELPSFSYSISTLGDEDEEKEFDDDWEGFEVIQVELQPALVFGKPKPNQIEIDAPFDEIPLTKGTLHSLTRCAPRSSSRSSSAATHNQLTDENFNTFFVTPQELALVEELRSAEVFDQITHMNCREWSFDDWLKLVRDAMKDPEVVQCLLEAARSGQGEGVEEGEFEVFGEGRRTLAHGEVPEDLVLD